MRELRELSHNEVNAFRNSNRYEIDLEQAFIKSKIDEMERERKFYQDFMKKEKRTQQNNIK